MIDVYTDCSYADSILSVGYVIYEASGIERELVTTGTRVINTDADDRDIEWCSNRGEFYAMIIGVRAALDHTSQALRLHTDSETVIQAIGGRGRTFEPYFQHALYSFLERFNEHAIVCIDRSENEAAHEQARVGLKIGRDIQQGVV